MNSLKISSKAHMVLKKIQANTFNKTRQKISLSRILDEILINLGNIIIAPLPEKKRKQRSDKGSIKVIGSNLKFPDELSSHFEEKLKQWCLKNNYNYRKTIKLLVEQIMPMNLNTEPDIASALMILYK